MFERKFVTLGRLLNHWDVIVGSELAKTTTPIKVTYRKITKGKNKGSKLGLIVSTDSSQAVLLHYRKDLMLAKINQILGDTIISDIKFVDRNEVTAAREKVISKKKPHKSLTQDQEKDLSSMLDEIEDDDLKQTLERFGQSMMIDARNANENT